MKYQPLENAYEKDKDGQPLFRLYSPDGRFFWEISNRQILLLKERLEAHLSDDKSSHKLGKLSMRRDDQSYFGGWVIFGPGMGDSPPIASLTGMKEEEAVRVLEALQK